MFVEYPVVLPAWILLPKSVMWFDVALFRVRLRDQIESRKIWFLILSDNF